MQHPGDSPDYCGYQTMTTQENSNSGYYAGKSEDREDARWSDCANSLTHKHANIVWTCQNFLVLKIPTARLLNTLCNKILFSINTC